MQRAGWEERVSGTVRTKAGAANLWAGGQGLGLEGGSGERWLLHLDADYTNTCSLWKFKLCPRVVSPCRPFFNRFLNIGELKLSQ